MYECTQYMNNRALGKMAVIQDAFGKAIKATSASCDDFVTLRLTH